MRFWHWLALSGFGIILLLSLWLALAYGELPRLWSKHEHKKVGPREEIVSYTSQDIPADPINLRLTGDSSSVRCAFQRAGWSLADPLSARSAVGIVTSVLLQRPYPQAPVSSLYFQNRLQDLAFEKDEGRSAHRRHHVRLWQISPRSWFGAATYDRGVGFALFTLQVTHHIGPNVDTERDSLGAMLQRAGAEYLGSEPSHIRPFRWRRNGGGDRYITDGQVRAYALRTASC
ncbi:MAG TPA: LssY C-terminal domain-containing protein [Sphingomicrobium sp.]|nr:LssY C-terminal domain-containing protein [Sphingomicrobium sp.]